MSTVNSANNVPWWELVNMTDQEIGNRHWVCDDVEGNGRLVSPVRFVLIRARRNIELFYLGERLRWTARLNKVLSALDARIK